MAPELLGLSTVSGPETSAPARKADVYSLGIVLFELWTSRPSNSSNDRMTHISLIRQSSENLKILSESHDFSLQTIKNIVLQLDNTQ